MTSGGLEELLDRFEEAEPGSSRSLTQYARLNDLPLNKVILEKINPNESESAVLRKRYPDLFLSEAASDRLKEVIANNESYKRHLGFKDLYTSEDEEKILQDVALKIHDSLSDEEKQRYSLSDISHYMTVMNLGVVVLPTRGGAKDFQDYAKDNMSLFLENEEIAVRILKNHYIKKGEMLYNGRLDKFLEDAKAELKVIGADKKTKSGKLSDLVMKELKKRVKYSQKLYRRCNELFLYLHQSNRVYEAVENGTKRILCGDATGAGKTLIATTTKFLLDEKEGRNTRAIVFAPGQTMDSVWTQHEISKHALNLNLEDRLNDQKVVTISKYSDFDKITDDASFIVINYDKLGITEDYKNNRYWKKIMGLCDNVDMTIFDEGHALKNPGKNAPRAFTEIINKTKDKHAMILTATPCPNKLKDIGYLLYMLNPSDKRFARYSNPNTPFVYNLDSTAIRDVMVKGQWFMFPKKAVQKIFGLPEIHTPDDDTDLIYLNMNEEEALEYFETWRPSGYIGEKVVPLRRTLLKSKIRQIEPVVSKFANENQQTILYTSLKKGVVKPFQKELEKIYGAGNVAIIDGDISTFKKKVALAKDFQNGKYQAIVCTGVIGEGISLSCGDKRVDLIIAEPCITPREYYQLIGRPHRKGQREDVYVHVLANRSEILENLMEAEIAVLEEEYDVKFRENWKPTTIDVDRFNMTLRKQWIFDEAVRRAIPLPQEMVELMDTDENSGNKQKGKAYTSLVSKKQFKERSNIKKKEYFGKFINLCSHLKGQKYNPENLNMLVKDYRNKEAWKVSTAAESNRAVIDLIKSLEDATNKEYNKIADLGSGPACLARIAKENGLEKRIDCVDGMKEMIELGKEFCKEEEVKKVNFYERELWDTGLKTRGYDIVSCLNALHYNDQMQERDIEKIIIESNRILKKDSYFIMGLIPSVESIKEMENVAKAMERYGFEIKYCDIIQVTGKDESTDKKKTSKIPYIIGKKIANHTKGIIEGPIEIYDTTKHIATGGEKRKYIFDPKKEKEMRKTKLVDKQYMTKSGKSLADEVKAWD